MSGSFSTRRHTIAHLQEMQVIRFVLMMFIFVDHFDAQTHHSYGRRAIMSARPRFNSAVLRDECRHVSVIALVNLAPRRLTSCLHPNWRYRAITHNPFRNRGGGSVEIIIWRNICAGFYRLLGRKGASILTLKMIEGRFSKRATCGIQGSPPC